MEFWKELFIVLQTLCGLSIIALVLMQQGKGADMGAAFGSGSSGTLFGAAGSANFLSRSTAVLAALFFTGTLVLTYLEGYKPKSSGAGVLGDVPVVQPASQAAASGVAGQATTKAKSQPAPSKTIPK